MSATKTNSGEGGPNPCPCQGVRGAKAHPVVKVRVMIALSVNLPIVIPQLIW